MQFFSGSVATEMTPSPAAPPGTATGLAGNNANMLYIFNRNGVCLLYREWHRPLRTLDAQQDQKLMFGLLFSLRSFTAKMDPTIFRTNTYKLSFMESPSGIKLILVTHPKTGDLRDALRYIYNLYVECELFDTNIDQYVKTLI
ncbi:hypothetical protein HPP92_005259 [Vanilla planifolia]|uniref:Trafficking protein particle complex subunit n=1 Tax=Vanilla planifolia TaxID=51239 RepID=A0A835VD08_VANPL|nr:hypothetical protein HPP92_005259 [Vanilla planifolia]